MPTVIDQLIVSLSLDPTGFTEGERQMATNLRRMETNSARAAQSIRSNFGEGFVSFTRGLEQPFSAMRRHFEQLVTQTSRGSPIQQNLAGIAATGRRAGAEVEAGAMSGAAGLRALGYAGVAAIATISLLDKTMKSASESATGVFGASIGSQAAGTSIERFTAISQALLTNQNVPQADTQGWLSGINQTLVGARRGDPGALGRFVALQQAFAQAGVPLDINADPAELMNRLAARFGGMSPDRRIELGGAMGMSDKLAAGLGAAGTNLPSEIELARRTAMTNADSAAARDLLEAQNKLGQSWEKLTRIIYDDLDPGFAAFDRWLSRIINIMTGVEVGPNGQRSNNAELLNPAPGDARPWWKRWLGIDKPAGTGKGAAPGTTGSAAPSLNGLTSDDLAIMDRESKGNPNIGWSGLRGTPEYSPGGTDLSNTPLDSTGFPDWAGKMGPAGNSTAAGLFMITKSNWHRIAPRLGIRDFSPESQLRVRRALQAESVAAGQPANSAWAASGSVLPVGSAATHMGPLGPRRVTDSDVHSQLDSINRVAAGGGPLGATQNSVSNNNLSVGDIHLTGTFREGTAAGAAVADELKRQMAVTFTNTGLSGP